MPLITRMDLGDKLVPADYFHERERAERAAAKSAASAAARRAHEELAERYAALSQQSRAEGELRS